MKKILQLLVLVMTCSIGYAQPTIDASKILVYLPLDDNINDASGLGQSVSEFVGTNNADGKTSFVTGVTGDFGSAISFDGAGLTIGGIGWWDSQTDFSLAGWVNLDQLSTTVGDAQIIVQQRNSSGTGRIFANISASDKLATQIDGNETADDDDFPSTGVWHHFAVIRNVTTGERDVYLNGAIVAEETITPTTSSMGALRVGISKTNGGAQYLDGSIDDLLLTTELLTQAQVQALAAGTIRSNISTFYNGSSWSDGDPTSTTNAVVSSSLTIGDGEDLTSYSLEVESGQTLTVEAGGLLDVKSITNNGSIVIESGATLLTEEGFSLDNVTFERNRSVSAGQYSMIGIPVTTANASDLGTSDFIYSYNEATDGWDDATAATLAPGQGYANAADRAMSFTGVPNSGDVTYNATFDGNGYNLIANPYAAAIDAPTFLNAQSNISGSAYLWNDGGSDGGERPNTDYVTINASGLTNGGTGPANSYDGDYIGSMQGFFIQTTAATTITFSESMRVSGNNLDANYFRKTEVPFVKLRLTDANGMERIATIGWADDANDIDINSYYDSRIFNSEMDFAIYTTKADEALVIQGITENREEIQLGLNLPVNGEYTIELLNEEFNDLSLFLRNDETGEVVDLSTTSFTFQSLQGQSIGDYTLLTNAPEVPLFIKEQLADIYVAKNVLHVNRAEKAVLKLYSLSGQSMGALETAGISRVDLSYLHRGVYILTDGLRSRKFIIN